MRALNRRDKYAITSRGMADTEFRNLGPGAILQGKEMQAIAIIDGVGQCKY